MNQTAKKALISALVLIFLSAGLVLTGMGKEKSQKDLPLSQSSGLTETSGTQNDMSPFVDGGSMTGPLLKLVFALGVVIAAIYGFLYLLRKMMGQKHSGNRSNQLIEVIETTYIAQKRSVSVIRFYNKAILVGICDGSIQRLGELSTEETAAVLSEKAEMCGAGKFAGVLSEAKTRLKSWNVARMLTKGAAGDVESPQTI